MNAALGQNLVVSKGSKKWIGADDRHLSDGSEVANDAAVVPGGDAGGVVGCGQLSSGASSAQDLGFAVPPSAVDEHSKLLGQNRDFLARLMSSASASHASHQHQHQHSAHSREEDENSSFLDVVESNNNAAAAAAAAAAAMSQYQHSVASNGAAGAGAAGGGGGGGSNGGTGGHTPTGGGGGSATGPGSVEPPQMQMNSLSHSQSFMSSFYNNANARLSSAGASVGVGVGVGANSSSASMLVEAALNSVGNMIDSESSDLKVSLTQG